MKSSKYNIYHEQDNKYFVYNQLSSSLSQIDKELFIALKTNAIESISDKSLLSEMFNAYFICEKDLIEENQIIAANNIYRYGKQIARITILPTLDCNFNCWYCYESHINSIMTNDRMEAIYCFCKNIIIKDKPQVFHLDWFGGEPLLFFDLIIYPLAVRIRKLCEMHKITFRHTITTNGYLINSEMIKKMVEIDLNGFQITLDGAKKNHNKIRYSETDKNTYQTITNNIIALCREIRNIDMTVRINYTPKNIATIDDIAYSFPEDVRRHIFIQPQIVWQFKDKINSITDTIKTKLSIFSTMGYKNQENITPQMNSGCYAENMLQFVINYDLSVYKCTARDFISPKASIGNIDHNGNFIPNSNYYNYYVSSYMENDTCLACKYLPSCHGMCIQKKIENSIPKCPKEEIEHSLINQLSLIVNKM